MQNINPSFVKISENFDTDDILDDLISTPFDINIGDEINIGGRIFLVQKLRDEQNNIKLKEVSDIKGNVRGYEELLRTEIITPDFGIDDLYLKNIRNGDALLEVSIPEKVYAAFEKKGKKDKILHNFPKNFFVRVDSTMLNNKFKEKNVKFEQTEIKLTPCMFASDSALAFTESGKQISITERNRTIDEKIMDLEVGNSFTLYEREIVSRLVGTVNLLAYNKKIDKITTALPRGAYYSFLFQGASEGFVSAQMVLDWFDIVDKRVKYLFLLIKKGIHQYNPHIPISQYSFMDNACEAMRNYFVERVKNPALPVILEELYKISLQEIEQKDSFARQLFASNVARPTTFTDLCNFTYSVGNLTNMEIKEGEKPITQQIIGVYDVTETMMWIEAKRLRNRGLLEFRGQFNPVVPQSTTYDNLSYMSVMPIEHIIFDVSPEFAEKYMGGFTRLYSVRQNAISNQDTANILGTI